MKLILFNIFVKILNFKIIIMKKICFILSLLLFTSMFVGCDEDDDFTPAYVGNWKSEYRFKNIETRHWLEIRKSSFTESIYTTIDDMGDIEHITHISTGNIIVKSNKITFKPKELKINGKTQISIPDDKTYAFIVTDSILKLSTDETDEIFKKQ